MHGDPEQEKVSLESPPSFDIGGASDILTYAIGILYADQQAFQGGRVCPVPSRRMSRLREPGCPALRDCGVLPRIWGRTPAFAEHRLSVFFVSGEPSMLRKFLSVAAVAVAAFAFIAPEASAGCNSGCDNGCNSGCRVRTCRAPRVRCCKVRTLGRKENSSGPIGYEPSHGRCGDWSLWLWFSVSFGVDISAS